MSAPGTASGGLVNGIAFYLGVIVVVVFGAQFTWMIYGASGMLLWFLLCGAVGLLGRWLL